MPAYGFGYGSWDSVGGEDGLDPVEGSGATMRNIYKQVPKEIKRIWPLGTSMTEGTGAGPAQTAGWREWFVRIMAQWGYTDFEMVGSYISNQATLDSIAGERMYNHSGKGGSGILGLRDNELAKHVDAAAPDIVVLECGQNDFGASLDDCRNRYRAIYSALAQRTQAHVLTIGAQPAKVSGAIIYDGAIHNVVQAHRELVAEFGQRFTFLSINRMFAQRIFASSLRPDWFQVGDNVHYNHIGVYWEAMMIARAMLGGDVPRHSLTPVSEVQYGTSAVAADAGGPVTDFVTSPFDVTVPQGAWFSYTNAFSTAQVLTVGGDLVTLTNDELPINTVYPVPIVRLMRHGATLSAGGSFLAAGKFIVRPLRVGTWL